MQRLSLLTFLIAVPILGGCQPQTALDAVLANNPGIEASANYESLFNSDTVVLNLKSVGPDNSMTDVSRVVFQWAEAMKECKVERVKFAFRGTQKFSIEGSYFREIGQTFRTQNPAYLVRTFPEHVFKLDGTQAFATWTGGIFGVLGKQIEDFNNFHKQWWLDDAIAQHRPEPVKPSGEGL